MTHEATIGVALIADDCLDQLQRLLPQLEKFDQVVIGWNGSDPEVKSYLDKLSKKKDGPYEYFHFDWRGTSSLPSGECGVNDWGFCYARNLSFERLKTSHALWLDTDDLIGYVKDGKDVAVSADQAYRAFKKIATEAPEDIDLWFSTYVYSRDSHNNPNVVHSRERLLKDPQSWKWVYPVHEVLVPDHQPKWAMIKDVQVIHYPPKKSETSADRNLRMLQDWKDQLAAAGPQYEHDLGRCRLNIGDTYWALNQWKLAADHLMEFIRKHPRALDIEKWQAWVFIAKCQIELNNFEAARAAALAAIDIEPGLRDGYILLAQVKLLTEQDPQDTLILIDQAARAEEPPPQVITNPLDYTYTPYCIASKCKYLLGQYDEALRWALKALEIAPNDSRADQLRSDAAIKVRERDTVEASKALYQVYRDYDENEKASRLYEILPYVAQRNDEIIAAADEARRRVRHLYDRDEYIKLYSQNSRWQPAEEEWIDAGEPAGRARMSYVLGRLRQALPNGGRILDVGCSDGFHSLVYAKEGYEVVGVDLDQRCADLANKRAEERNLPAKFIHGFFEEMDPEKTLDPFDLDPQHSGYYDDGFGPPPRTWHRNFDAVVCSEVIEHVQNPEFLLGSLVDCAKDNAPVIITTPDEAFDKGDIPVDGGMHEDNADLAGHVRVFTQEAFEALLKSDPEIDVVESHFVPADFAYREHQGWQVGEIRRRPRPDGPIIRVYCGDAVKFSPGDQTRCGGSEIAVINMARHWASFGCQVVVYGGENGIYDGVFYRTTESYSPDHYSDIYVAWRMISAFEEKRPNAAKTVLWCHDLYFPVLAKGHELNEVPQEWVDRMDVIAVLSKFHEQYITSIHKNFAGKTWVTRNGIDPLRYLDRNVAKVPHRYFYSSDFGRGLEELLDVWPSIKAAIPDAELHVSYRLETAEFICKLSGGHDKLQHIYRLIARMKRMDGVVYYEGLGQQELADLQLSCEAWLYPPQPDHESGAGGFLETFMIGKLEAQAARCACITRLNGAIPEHLPHAIEWKPDLDIVDVLARLDRHWKPEWTEENFRSAVSLSWEALAVEWLRELAPRGDAVAA